MSEPRKPRAPGERPASANGIRARAPNSGLTAPCGRPCVEVGPGGLPGDLALDTRARRRPGGRPGSDLQIPPGPGSPLSAEPPPQESPHRGGDPIVPIVAPTTGDAGRSARGGYCEGGSPGPVAIEGARCRACGGPRSPGEGRANRRRYCSRACARNVEYRARRLRREVGRLVAALRALRSSPAVHAGLDQELRDPLSGTTVAARVAALRTELDSTRAALRRLR